MRKRINPLIDGYTIKTTKMITKKEFEDALNVVIQYKAQLQDEIQQINDSITNGMGFLKSGDSLETPIKNMKMPLSVRCYNSIISSNLIGKEPTIKDLTRLSFSAWVRCRNVGQKSLVELREVMDYLSLPTLP